MCFAKLSTESKFVVFFNVICNALSLRSFNQTRCSDISVLFALKDDAFVNSNKFGTNKVLCKRDYPIDGNSHNLRHFIGALMVPLDQWT